MDATLLAEVMASEARLLDAMRRSDADTLDALLHDGLLFNGPTGETAGKALDLKNYRSGNITLQVVDASDRHVSIVDDDVIVAVTVEIRGRYMGQDIDGKFRYLRVWKRFDGGLKVIAGSVVPLSPGT
jgi:hypothetical protein